MKKILIAPFLPLLVLADFVFWNACNGRAHSTVSLRECWRDGVKTWRSLG